MKIAVTTYSFLQLIWNNEMKPIECVAKAKELGFDGLEVSDNFFPKDVDPVEFARQVVAEAKRVDIPLTNFAFRADFASCEDLDAEIARVKGMIDVAEILGVKSVRHDVIHNFNKFRSFDLALPQLVKAIREVADYAQTKGIRTMVENHGFVCQDSTRVERLFNAVNHENFSILLDIGNFMCADESPEIGVGRLAPYAAYVHAKDFLFKDGNGADPGEGFFRTRGKNHIRGTVVGHGCVPVKQCLDIVKASGYDGYISIEYEGMEPVLRGLQVGMNNVKRYLDL